MYFKGELDNYKEFKNNAIDLINWMKRSHTLFNDHYVCFNTIYGLEEESSPSSNLKVNILEEKSYNLYVGIENFKSTIEFLQIFKKHFYDDGMFHFLDERMAIELCNSKFKVQ